MANRVTIRIHNQNYNILAEEDESYIQQCAEIVKSELALHPAEKHAKGTGAHHIGVYLKGSFVPARVFFVFVFMHNQALVSITMVISSIPDILYSFIHSVKP